ncbi:MAG: flagellar biosynthesis protein FlhA [Desulfosarcinaceae bacterium]
MLSRHSDILMGLGAMGILMVMVIPIPPLLLDLLLSFNITFSLLILLMGMYVLKPLELSSFPTILLLTTLFRLSLNVASTRIILLNGQTGVGAAGKVIGAFGNFVVGGNYLVGLIVFIILVVINFVVITKGAGRIAEVAARFTLDAMPGKQMSIDADLNAGLIDEQEARERRELITKESEYYGAMDGANKFVRGDAIAGIIITLVNILAGFAIGVFQNQMGFGEAARTYTLLTVGDGLVSQIPALIISTAAGIIVSRAGSDSNLGSEISSQLLVQPRAIGLAAAILFGLGLIPGLPTGPFFVLSAGAGLIAYLIYRSERASTLEETEALEEADETAETTPDLHAPLPPVDILGLEVGYGLIPLVDVQQGGELLDRIKSIRHQIAQEVGIVVPSIHIQDNMQLKPGEYLIRLKGVEIARAEMMINYHLAMNPGNAQGKIEGVGTTEPTYGLPAYWIKSDKRDTAMAKGYTVVDVPTVMTTHLSDVIRRQAHELLGRQEVHQLLEALKSSHPKAVEELVPNLMTLGGVVKVLQGLLAEQVPVRDLLTIVEALADWAPSVKHLDLLTEYARQALARTITSLYRNDNNDLYVLTLDPSLEKHMVESVQQTDQGTFLALDPIEAQGVMQSIAHNLEKFAPLGVQPVVLCATQLRSHFKKMADRFIPNLVVLAYDEILPTIKIQSLATVELNHAD